MNTYSKLALLSLMVFLGNVIAEKSQENKYLPNNKFAHNPREYEYIKKYSPKLCAECDKVKEAWLSSETTFPKEYMEPLQTCGTLNTFLATIEGNDVLWKSIGEGDIIKQIVLHTMPKASPQEKEQCYEEITIALRSAIQNNKIPEIMLILQAFAINKENFTANAEEHITMLERTGKTHLVPVMRLIFSTMEFLGGTKSIEEHMKEHNPFAQPAEQKAQKAQQN